MELPTSMASSDSPSTSFSLPSSASDPIHSFRLFLDLITPTELSKLLRERVRHLLSIWPPHSPRTEGLSTPTPSLRSEHPTLHTLESIEAFTAFFRPHDSPPSSPIEDSLTTSLSALRHKLLALQTLLSFLSGRELKDIVRARLAEGSKAKLVPGVMDIMQSPEERGGEEMLEARLTQSPTVPSGNSGEHAKGEYPPSMGTENLAPLSVSTFNKPKIPVKSLINSDVITFANDQPPRKRQKVLSSEPSGGQPETMSLQYDSIPSLGSQSQGSTSPIFSQYSQTGDISTSANSTALTSNVLISPDTQVSGSENSVTTDQINQTPTSPLKPEGGLVPPEPKLTHSHESADYENVRSAKTGLSASEEKYKLNHGINEDVKGSDTVENSSRHSSVETTQQRNEKANEEMNESHVPAVGGLEICEESDNDKDSDTSVTRSSSFRMSFSERGASPPGPILRSAVDWASGISSTLDGGSDHTLSYEGATIFNHEPATGLTTGMFVPKPFMHKPSDDWDEDSDVLTNAAGSAIAEMNVDANISRRERLIIRLPARPKGKLAGPGVAGSAMASDSPTRTRAASGGVTPVTELDAKGDTERNIHRKATANTSCLENNSNSAQDLLKRTSEYVSPPKGPPPRAPVIAAPHAKHPIQFPPGARPHSGSPRTLPQRPYTMPGSAYPGQPHPYPGPWFGAMFYVPFRGHPQTAMQQTSKVPGGSSMQTLEASAPRRLAAEEISTPSGPMTIQIPPSVPPPSAPKRRMELDASPPSPVLDPDVTYTDDIGVKESPTLKRRCFNCHGIQAPSWRKSKLTFGKILCNKCGIYESTHMMARPLKTRPRRAQMGPEVDEGSPPKKRKPIKKLSVNNISALEHS